MGRGGTGGKGGGAGEVGVGVGHNFCCKKKRNQMKLSPPPNCIPIAKPDDDYFFFEMNKAQTQRPVLAVGTPSRLGGSREKGLKITD